MTRYAGTKYRSLWDGSTWLLIGIATACCIVPCFLDYSLWPMIICLTSLAFVLVTFSSIYYRIDDSLLIVYTFFIPEAYPIAKISEIKPSSSWLSAPATSLSHRLAISFSDRKILKSSLPLLISPVRQKQFIAQLLAINPSITVHPTSPGNV